MSKPPHTGFSSTHSPNQEMIQLELTRAFVALENKNFPVVVDIAKALLKVLPQLAQAHYLIARVTIETQQLDIAIKSLQTAIKIEPEKSEYWAYLGLIYSQVGQLAQAEDAVQKAQQLGSEQPDVLHPMAYVLSTLGHYTQATEHLRKAIRLSPDNSVFHHALGVNLLEVGELKGAQKAFEKAVKCNGNDVKSRWLLSSLVKANNNNMPDQLIELMGKTNDYAMHNAFLGYAAGKWYEDTQSWQKAFDAYQLGAAGKRRTVHYDQSQAQNTFATIKGVCTKKWCNSDLNPNTEPGPIFVVGQPRTGSTLIDRIISSHSLVHSAGEPVQMAMSLRGLTGVRNQEFISAQLVEQAQNLNASNIAESYLNGVGKIRGKTPFFVDKFPLNFMLIGFINKAFPNAKIIHVTRNPMDTCFAVFKQLFEDVYPHSYDQLEMAQHYIMYRDLMTHWHQVLPGKILDIAYEDVTTDLTAQARKLVDYIGLEWQDACASFEQSKSAVVTASAAQVREKVHSRSVGKWKNYAQQLAPTLQALEAAGIPIEP